MAQGSNESCLHLQTAHLLLHVEAASTFCCFMLQLKVTPWLLQSGHIGFARCQHTQYCWFPQCLVDSIRSSPSHPRFSSWPTPSDRPPQRPAPPSQLHVSIVLSAVAIPGLVCSHHLACWYCIGAEHRCGGAADAGRCAGVCREELQGRGHHRRGHPDRGGHGCSGNRHVRHVQLQPADDLTAEDSWHQIR